MVGESLLKAGDLADAVGTFLAELRQGGLDVLVGHFGDRFGAMRALVDFSFGVPIPKNRFDGGDVEAMEARRPGRGWP